MNSQHPQKLWPLPDSDLLGRLQKPANHLSEAGRDTAPDPLDPFRPWPLSGAVLACRIQLDLANLGNQGVAVLAGQQVRTDFFQHSLRSDGS